MKKGFSRLLALNLAIILFFSFPAGVFAQSMDLFVGSTMMDSTSESYQFSPENSGWYSFSITTEGDLVLYDGETLLASVENAGDENGYGFYIKLETGKTYTLQCENESVEFPHEVLVKSYEYYEDLRYDDHGWCFVPDQTGYYFGDIEFENDIYDPLEQSGIAKETWGYPLVKDREYLVHGIVYGDFSFFDGNFTPLTVDDAEKPSGYYSITPTETAVYEFDSYLETKTGKYARNYSTGKYYYKFDAGQTYEFKCYSAFRVVKKDYPLELELEETFIYPGNIYGFTPESSGQFSFKASGCNLTLYDEGRQEMDTVFGFKTINLTAEESYTIDCYAPFPSNCSVEIQYVGPNPQFETQGSCGENLTWSYDETTKTLTISGTGAMDEFSLDGNNDIMVPWLDCNRFLEHLVIQEGVTAIEVWPFTNVGGNPDYAYTNLRSISLPESLTSVTGPFGFNLYNLYNLTDIYYAGSESEYLALGLPASSSITYHFAEATPVVPAPGPNATYTENMPESIKVGDPLPTPDITFHHLVPGATYETNFDGFTTFKKNGDPETYDVNEAFYYRKGAGWGGDLSGSVDANGNLVCEPFSEVIAYEGLAHIPGILTVKPALEVWTPTVHGYDYNKYPIGAPFNIAIEEPVITHNAPATVEVGSALNLATSLTNVSLQNQKVASYPVAEAETHLGGPLYSVPEGMSALVYQPVVEVVEGESLISRSNQDYSNTLTSSETITFNGEGTVKLKIRYKQLITTTKCETYDLERMVTIQVVKSLPHVHSYTNNCDTACDVCGEVRAITHAFGEYVYNNDATMEKDGTQTRTCAVCGHSETIAAPGTLIVLSNPFTDVKAGTYYEKPVLWAVNKGITNGMGNGQFKPNETCTRGQIVTFLWRANGCPEPQSSVNPFSDVPANAYYTKAVLWAVEQGITNGTGGGKFSPADECIREQIVTFLWRSQGKPAMGSANPFKDVQSGTFYYDAVLWAVDKGITKGTSATTFAPKDDCTRGQIVTFLYRCLA